MFTNARLGCILMVSLLCTGAALAQQSGPRTEAGKGRFSLDVVVTPKSGPPVTGLQQQDFTILDNESPQTIASFAEVNSREAATAIILVIDAVNATAQSLDYTRLQLEKFLRDDGGRLAYPTALAVFTDKGIQIAQNFSSDGNSLASALQQDNIGLRFIGHDTGYQGAVELNNLSLQALNQLLSSEVPRPGNKAMIWLSPGWPLLSGVNTELTSDQQKQIFGNIVSFSTLFRNARVTLYSINPLGAGQPFESGFFYKDFLKGISKPEQSNLGDLGLPVFAVQSGGLAFDFANDIDGTLHQCVADLAPYYEISFDPPPAKRPNEYHQLEIKLANPGLTARARQGYYAQP